VAVTPDGSKVYVTNGGDGTVSVIDTATDTVIDPPIPVGGGPFGVEVTPDGSKVYVTNGSDGTVSVIDTATDTVIATIPVGLGPFGVAVTPDGSKVYVANSGRRRETNTVSVIDTATDTVSATISVGFGSIPTAFGKFIGPPPPEFAGTPGFSNCQSQSVAALTNQFGTIDAAAAGLGLRRVQALQAAIAKFCRV
jgi:YVTN family beta-propeller protein